METFGEKHVEDAARLVLAGYRAECRAVPPLPDTFGTDAFRKDLESLAEAGLGVAGIDGGRLVGFLAGWPVPQFFSSRPGIYIPLTGHGATGDGRLVYQRLYAEAAGRWVAEGRLMHVITLFAHDGEAVDSWFWNGFGLRCVDAIRDLSAIRVENPLSLTVCKATKADLIKLSALHREHHGYYRQSPLFMPTVALEESLEAWVAQSGDRHVWLALRQNDPVAYLMLTHGGENFVCQSPDMRNICGAYTLPALRGSNAGTLLLAEIIRWMDTNGFARLGVDFESFNVAGSRFWRRHFTPYTFSLVRAIDDRIL